MSSKKTYVVPGRMHYDIYEVWDRTSPRFLCSCSKENEAITIMQALVLSAIEAGNAWNQTQYKIRARPTVEHTIHSLRV